MSVLTWTIRNSLWILYNSAGKIILMQASSLYRLRPLGLLQKNVNPFRCVRLSAQWLLLFRLNTVFQQCRPIKLTRQVFISFQNRPIPVVSYLLCGAACTRSSQVGRVKGPSHIKPGGTKWRIEGNRLQGSSGIKNKKNYPGIFGIYGIDWPL